MKTTDAITFTAGSPAPPQPHPASPSPGGPRRVEAPAAAAAPDLRVDARVSRATSAQVRRPLRLAPGPRRRAARGPRRRPRSSRGRSPGDPGRAARRGSRPVPTISGSAPTADATTGVPAAIASIAGRPAASESDRQDRGPGAADQAGEPLVGQRPARRRGLRRRRPARRPGRARPGRPARRPTSSTRGGHGGVGGRPSGRPAAASRASAAAGSRRSWRASYRPE